MPIQYSIHSHFIRIFGNQSSLSSSSSSSSYKLSQLSYKLSYTPLQQVEAAVVIVPEAVPVALGAAGPHGADAVVVHHHVHPGLLTELLLPLLGSLDHGRRQTDQSEQSIKTIDQSEQNNT